MYLGKSAWFDLAITSAALLGVGWRGGSSFRKFILAFWRDWHLSIIVCFTRCISTSWIFSCACSSPCKIWTVSWWIYSWGYFWGSIYPTSSEGVPKLSENLSNFSRVMCIDYFILLYPTIISKVYAFFTGLLFYCALVWQVSLGSCLPPNITYFLGDAKFLEGMLRSCK